MGQWIIDESWIDQNIHGGSWFPSPSRPGSAISISTKPTGKHPSPTGNVVGKIALDFDQKRDSTILI